MTRHRSPEVGFGEISLKLRDFNIPKKRLVRTVHSLGRRATLAQVLDRRPLGKWTPEPLDPLLIAKGLIL
jgi:hypothetical protein